MLEWDNHESYDDREVTLLGVYLTAEERDRAIGRYNAYPKQWPFNGWTPGQLDTPGGRAHLVLSEIQANADLIERHK